MRQAGATDTLARTSPAAPSSGGRSTSAERPTVKRPAFMGGRPGVTTWCRTYGNRALEEELRPQALAPVPAHMATPLEKQFAEVLGVEDEVMFPRLPMEVGSCEQGPRCCWRWLTRAALEEIAGTSLGHRGLAEAISKLRQDVANAIELRSWAEAAGEELEQAVLNKQELDKLRKAHEEVLQEVKDLRTQESEIQRLHEENKDLKEAYDRIKKAESEVQLNLTRLQAERVMLVEGDLAAAQKRAEHAEREIESLYRAREEFKASNADLERNLAHARRDLAFEKDKNTQMKQEAEDVIRRMKVRSKRKRTKPGIPKFR